MSRTSSGENTGILRTWLSSPMTAMAVPSETSADSSGRSMAKSEPNTRNRTMPAAMMPTPVPPTDGLFACSAICPETEMASPSPEALVAVFTKSCACAMEKSCDGSGRS